MKFAPAIWRTGFIPCCLTALISSLLIGCGGHKGPTLAPVKGVVLYNGQPLEGAVVEFIQDKSPVRSIGFTDPKGAFELTSLRPGDGAPVGPHKVTVTKRTKVEHPAAAASSPVNLETIADPHERRLASTKNSVAEKAAAETIAAGKSSAPRDLLPPKYTKTDTSGLEFTVKASAENLFQIVLSD